MKTLNKFWLLSLPLLKEWLIFIGIIQIENAVAYLLTKQEVIEGPVWQIIFPVQIMIILRLVDRYNNWLDGKKRIRV